MSHGGMGGGGGHGGGHVGHHSHGGHSSSGHAPAMPHAPNAAHAPNMGHGNSFLSALTQHGQGGLFGHLLHALGLNHGGHVTHSHHSGLASHGNHPDQVPNWNMAMQSEKSWWAPLKRIDRRPFFILFFMFFGGGCWLYLLYSVHHHDAVRDHTDVLDFRQRDSLNNNRLFSASNEASATPAPAPAGFGATPDATGAQAYSGTFSPAMFGAPRAQENMPESQAVSAQSTYSQATALAATQAVQSQYAQAAATALYPFGSGADPNQSVQAMVPADYNPHQALIGPRSLRHAVGAPMGYAPCGNGRQRLVVNR